MSVNVTVHWAVSVFNSKVLWIVCVNVTIHWTVSVANITVH